MKTKRTIALLIALIMVFGTLSGFGGRAWADENTYTGEKILYLSTGGQLASINPLEDGTEFWDGRLDMFGTMVTLMAKKDGSGIEFVPNHCAELPSSEDGRTYICKFRDDVVFTDGTPINAATYEYTFRMALDPLLVNYGAYALFEGSAVVTNAEKYYMGECEWEDVGIKLIDDQTLEVTLDFDCPEIDFWMTVGAFPPVEESLYEACMNEDRTSNTYGTSLDKIACGGAFEITDWVLDQKLVFTKREGYPLSEYFKIDGIDVTLTNDANAAYELFLKGSVDSGSVSDINYDRFADDPRVLYRDGYVFWGLWMNTEDYPALGNNNLRRAMFYGVPRDAIAKNIMKTSKPASFYVPYCAYVGDAVNGEGEPYRNTPQAKAVNGGDPICYNPELAREYFEKAYEELGMDKIVIEVEFFETNDSHRNVIEYMQEEYTKLFGADRFELVLRAVPPLTVYSELGTEACQTGFAANTINVFNPWASFKNFRGDYEGRRHKWNSDEFNELQFACTKGELANDPEAKIDALARMEEILVEGVPYIPFYTNDSMVIYSDRIQLITDVYLPQVEFALFQCDITGERVPFE